MGRETRLAARDTAVVVPSSHVYRSDGQSGSFCLARGRTERALALDDYDSANGVSGGRRLLVVVSLERVPDQKGCPEESMQTRSFRQSMRMPSDVCV